MSATWRLSGSLKERRHGGHDLGRWRVSVVDDTKELLSVRILCGCHVVVCVSRLPLPLPDHVPVVVAAVMFRMYLNGRFFWWRDVACWSVIPFRDCYVVVCISRLQLLLSDRVDVSVVVVAAAVVFWLHLEQRTCCWCIGKDGKDVMDHGCEFHL